MFQVWVLDNRGLDINASQKQVHNRMDDQEKEHVIISKASPPEKKQESFAQKMKHQVYKDNIYGQPVTNIC